MLGAAAVIAPARASSPLQPARFVFIFLRVSIDMPEDVCARVPCRLDGVEGCNSRDTIASLPDMPVVIARARVRVCECTCIHASTIIW